MTVSIISIFILLGIAVFFDIREFRIPNWLTFISMVFGVFYNSFIALGIGFFASLLGILTGLTILLLPYSLNAMGAGDVKLLMAVGAWLGPWNTLNGFLWGGLIGGVLGLVGMAWQGQLQQRLFIVISTIMNLRPLNLGMDEEGLNKVKLPYAVPIALGYFAYFLFGGLV